VSFAIDISPKIEKEMIQLGGWAYLRRRSTNTGDFMDKWGDEWNEYMDKLSCEYFYWMEEDNVYQWMKPPLPDRCTHTHTHTHTYTHTHTHTHTHTNTHKHTNAHTEKFQETGEGSLISSQGMSFYSNFQIEGKRNW